VSLLLSAALLCVAQSPLPSTSATGTISATIDDVDSGQPLSNAHLKVQLFRPERGDRKFLSGAPCARRQCPAALHPCPLPPVRMAHSPLRHPQAGISLRSLFPSGSRCSAAFCSTRKSTFENVAAFQLHYLSRTSPYLSAPRIRFPDFPVTWLIVGFVPKLRPRLVNGSKFHIL
jgi:hypothetical protein